MRHTIVQALLILTLLTPSWAAKKGHPRVMRMQATAFALKSQPTAAGTVPHRGIVAADPAVLPLGSRIRISGAGRYNGVYTVTDTGGNIDGRRIDLYMPTAAEAKRFGRKMVQVQLLETGKGKEDAQAKSIPSPNAKR